MTKEAKKTTYAIEPLVKLLRSEAISDGGTAKKAAELKGTWIRLNETMFVFEEAGKVTLIYSDRDEVGCVCKAFSDPSMNVLCEHIIAAENLKEPPQLTIESPDCRWLREYLFGLGWYTKNGYLYPSLDSELQEDVPSKLDPVNEDHDLDIGIDVDPNPKKYTRACSFCGHIETGDDLDIVKQHIDEHRRTCAKNPANKQKSARLTTQTVDETDIPIIPDPVVKESLTTENTTNAKTATVDKPNEEEPDMEEGSKMYEHPDGTEFETAEALLDYVDKLKAEQTTTQARSKVQHKPMIKGISPRLQEVGRIAVGEKGGLTQSGKSRLPTKLDHFIFTTTEKDADDRYLRDQDMMQMFGDNCTEIPIRLLYNDIELNFPTFYAKYARSGIKLRGDGENWTMYNEDGTRDEIFDPNNERGFLDDPDVKPHGILTVLVEGQNSVGGVFKFRTTSWNSINNILSSLSLIKNMCGMLTYIPLKLVYRKKDVQPKGMAHKTWIPVVSVEFRGSIEELQVQASEVRHYITAGQRAETKQIEAAVREHLIDDESIDTQQDIAAEFCPGVE